MRVSDGFFGVRGAILASVTDTLITNTWFNGADEELAATPADIFAIRVHNGLRVGVTNSRFSGFQRAVDLVNTQASTFSDLKVHLNAPANSSSTVYGVRLSDDTNFAAPFTQGSRYVSFANCVFQNSVSGQTVNGVLEANTSFTDYNQFVCNMFQPFSSTFSNNILLNGANSVIK